MALLDTDILIDLQRGYPPAVQWFASLAELPAVPGFVVMELIQDAPTAQHVRAVLKLVAPLLLVWPTAADCQRALADFTLYHLSHRLGMLDAFIAAMAVGRAEPLYTFNVKHYQCVAGLVMQQPYSKS